MRTKAVGWGSSFLFGMFCMLLLIATGGCSRQSDSLGESGDEASEEYATFWEIGGMLDEYQLDVEFDPDVPKADTPVEMIVMCSIDDMGRPFQGTVSYRLAHEEENSEEWTEMTPGNEGMFETSVTLPKGRTYVQLKVNRTYDEGPIELTDWYVEVK